MNVRHINLLSKLNKCNCYRIGIIVLTVKRKSCKTPLSGVGKLKKHFSIPQLNHEKMRRTLSVLYFREQIKFGKEHNSNDHRYFLKVFQLITFAKYHFKISKILLCK